jgi:hypothetical protein
MPIIFATTFENIDPNARFTYNWSLSAGKITSGQGSPVITIDVTGTGGQSITATVEVGGLDSSCEQTASCTLSPHAFPPPARKFDEYGDITRKEEKVRLDRFAIQLQNDTGVEGYIIAYDRQAGAAQARADRAKNLLVSYYGISAERIVTINGGYRKSREVELWVAPPGAIPPAPTPEVPPDKVQVGKEKAKHN